MTRRKNKPERAEPRGELALIERIRRRASIGGARSSLKLGIGDDCAILAPPPGAEIVVTTDFSLEGRHFRRDWHSPQSMGHRTLARGLSDLASMGATPLAAFLSLALPRAVAQDSRWLDGFLDGFLALAKKFKVPLAGGDTSESPSDHILADIVLLGLTPADTALRRSGGRAGDVLYCTGALGGASAELASLESTLRKPRREAGNHPHLFPAPRIAVGEQLREKGIASACIDLSDGLSTDLAHLCKASGVHAEVEAAALPMHPLTRKLSPKEALHGGEDYELLFTAQASVKVPRTIAGIPLTRIGKLLTRRRGQPQVTLINDNGARTELKPAGWEHLQ